MEDNKRTIGIVTVLYNSEKVLDEYFESLSKQTYPDFILYIIDNKSPDDSLAKAYKLKEEYPQIRCCIIANSVNGGVAQGNNIGIKKALKDGCGYVLLSNNDVVLADNAIELLIDGLLQNKLDMAVPKIFFYDDPLIWYAGGKFRLILGSTVHTGYMKPDSLAWNHFKLVGYAPTCFMLITKEVFESVGVFDEKYFVYYDDTDWIYRCNKQNKRLGYIPDSVLKHKESTSTGGMKSDFYIKYNYRNQVYFCRKNFSKVHNILVAACNLLYFFLMRRKDFDNQRRKLLKEAIFNGLKM